MTNVSPITGYRVYIQEHSQGTFTQEQVNCLGSSAQVIAEQKCFINLDTLIVAPYSLVLNEDIWAKVVAFNVYGDSPISDAGNNALTKLIPDAPVNLANNPAVTNALRIGLSW